MIRKRWAIAALAAAIGLILGAASMVVAGGGVVLTAQANDLAVIKAASSVDEVVTSSSTYSNVDGAVRRATSTGTSNLFVATFSANAYCSASDCQARIIVKDLAGSTVGVMNPAEDHNFVEGSEEANSITRWINGLAAATYDFQVQFKSSGCCFDIDQWSLTLERYT